jgi:hypothetical protein
MSVVPSGPGANDHATRSVAHRVLYLDERRRRAFDLQHQAMERLQQEYRAAVSQPHPHSVRVVTRGLSSTITSARPMTTSRYLRKSMAGAQFRSADADSRSAAAAGYMSLT